METQNKSKPMTVILSDGEISALINLSNASIEKPSPLLEVKGIQPPASNTSRLLNLGLLDSANSLTPECQKAISILANPDIEIRLLWGDSDKVNFSSVFSTFDSGPDSLVSFTRSKTGENHFSYFVSPEEITDVIGGKISIPEIKEAPGLSLEAGVSALPVFLAVLDLCREGELRALLDRRQEFAIDFSQKEIMRILLEARTESSLAWYAPLGYMIMPVELNESGVSQGLNALNKDGIIVSGKGVNALSSSLNTFSHLAFPVIGYCGLNISVNRGNIIEKTYLGLIRGLGTLLLIQQSSDNGDRILINSIGTSDVHEILFNISTQPFEQTAPAAKPAPPPTSAKPEGITCSKCGTPNLAGAKFCAKCGTGLASKAGFCPKCGNAASVNEKFCKKCGVKLMI